MALPASPGARPSERSFCSWTSPPSLRSEGVDRAEVVVPRGASLEAKVRQSSPVRGKKLCRRASATRVRLVSLVAPGSVSRVAASFFGGAELSRWREEKRSGRRNSFLLSLLLFFFRTSDRARSPAEFKHINKRRKRN